MVITILRFSSHITWNASDPRSVTLKMIYGITCDLSPTCPLSCDCDYLCGFQRNRPLFRYIAEEKVVLRLHNTWEISVNKIVRVLTYTLHCHWRWKLNKLVLDWMTCVLLWTPHAADSWLVLSFDVNMTINLISVSWTLFYQCMCGRTSKNVCVHNF